jgi:site-specific DNA-methyltransferase (adenine-specific)
MIYCGDSLEVLKGFEDNSIDAVVTDPPYGLSFMGKKWDYDVPSTELWTEVFRVLKPGGHLLSFAGTRTQHRMAVNIEDAGFEIRDMIAWVYGSGFPKSLNIGKAVDKMEGTEYPKNTLISENSSMSGGNYTRNTIDVQSEKAKQWEGWGTALKPALEPITVARKPIKGTVANNVLEYGTGGLNIDGTRVKTDDNLNKRYESSFQEGNSQFVSETATKSGKRMEIKAPDATALGRFPANLIHDGSDEVVELFPDSKSNSKAKPSNRSGGVNTNFAMSLGNTTGYVDSGSAARFFYCAKASKSERNKGLEGFDVKTVNDGRDTPIDNAFQRGETPRANIHPTVKPVKLMQYLVRLVTPKGGTVLDLFTGSGTTGIACKLEGFEFIGIEREQEYVDIAQARIDAWEPDPQQELL